MNWYRFSIGLSFAFAIALHGFVPSDVQAVPINYSFTGTGSGTVEVTGFNDAEFTVSINADTNDVAFQPSLGAFGILNLSGTIDITGIGVAEFTLPLFIFGGNGMETIGFGNFGNGNLIAIFESGLGLAGYDLMSNFGPVTSLNYNLNQFVNVTTSLGTLSYSTMSDATFVSTINAVPEPSSFMLAGIGVLGLLGYRLWGKRAARE